MQGWILKYMVDRATDGPTDEHFYQPQCSALPLSYACWSVVVVVVIIIIVVVIAVIIVMSLVFLVIILFLVVIGILFDGIITVICFF